MAFNWNFKPRTLNGFNSAPVESLMPQAPGAIPTQMKGQGFSPDYNIQGLPQDTENYQRAAYMDAYEADEAQKAQALQAQQAGQQKRIADIQNQIATLEKRIAENTAKLQNFAGNADQIAAIEARKINAADPTSIWRWKQDKDYATKLAAKQNGTDNTAKANAMIEIANDLDSIIVDDKMTSQDQKAYLSKLSNMKTLGEKAGVPKSVIDNINAKIAEVKGETNSETKKGPEGSEYEGTSRDQWDNEAKELLSKPNLTQGDITKFKQKNPNISNEVRQELEKKHSELIESDKKKTYEKKWNSYLADYEKQNGKVSDKFKATLRRLYDKKNKKD